MDWFELALKWLPELRLRHEHLLLLHGLVAGFVGPGAGLSLIGAIWCGVFLWFWLSGVREAGWGRR